MFLEVKNLYKTYGDKEVLKDINFSLGEGNILCILGCLLYTSRCV